MTKESPSRSFETTVVKSGTEVTAIRVRLIPKEKATKSSQLTKAIPIAQAIPQA